MRVTTTKSVLKRKLQIEHTARLDVSPQAVIIDGCALLCVVHWPTNGTVQDFVSNYTTCVICYLKNSDVYLVFDRYYPQSIKGVTHTVRGGKVASRHHKLSSNTPLPPQKVSLTVAQLKIKLG